MTPKHRAESQGERAGLVATSLAILIALVACSGGGADPQTDTSSSGATDSPSTTASTTGPDSISTSPDSSGTAPTTADSTANPTESGSGSVSTTADDSTTIPTESGSSETGIGDCHPLVVEVFYDAVGGDDGLQWVKLYNPCGAAIDLAGHVIGYGGFAYGPYDTLGDPLGVIDAGVCYIAGGGTSKAGNGGPVLDFDVDFEPNLDTAEENGGAVALFDVAVLEPTSVPIDAVVYGPNNANGLIDETGQPVAAPHVGNPASGGSIRRVDETATWEIAAVPTPNVCPPF